MKEHPDKHIRAAIDYARARGWIFIAGGKSAHCFGRLRCGTANHREHMMSVWSNSCRSREPREANYQDGRPLSFNVDGLV
ncbi:Uncharacterised protein [Raoultella terrigena]|uniref:Uncharacterized protein n=1 Tax=Raoultella terrigena TaxID=577 RepID=A0A4U9CZB0_RAOTE|nr:Uncharacterised protein [Raoultella terrigena]